MKRVAMGVVEKSWSSPCTVTVIGGGTGSQNVLAGLRPHRHLQISSVVTMADSGGDSGRLRADCNVLPPGDVRRCLVALAECDPLLLDLFNHRFDDTGLEGRQLGNLLLLALQRTLGSETEALDAAHQLLKVRGRVVPVSWQCMNLCAELVDGRIIRGEANIDVPKHDATVAIKRVFLQPAAHANPEAARAIRGADVIVLAPGDLYTSTIPNFLVPEIAHALAASDARLIYVLNLMTKRGETNDYSASHHVEEIAKYAGRVPEVVIAHGGRLPDDMVKRYRAEQARPVIVDEPALRALGVRRVVRQSVMSAASKARHDPDRTAKVLVELFAEPAFVAARPTSLTAKRAPG